MEENKIKKLERKIRDLFICRVSMWLICAVGCGYWIYWSFKLYGYEENYDVHVYAANFRPHFNIGITISAISLVISLILRIISDVHKKAMKEEMFKVR